MVARFVLALLVAVPLAAGSAPPQRTKATTPAHGSSDREEDARHLAQSLSRQVETVPLMAKTPEDEALVKALRLEKTRWDAAATKGPMELYANVPGNKVVRVPDPNDWPETETSYALLRDDHRRIRVLQISPTSRSGDWSFTATFFFDTAGQVIILSRYFGTFNSGCDNSDLAKETITQFFGPKLRLIARDYAIVTENGASLIGHGCQLMPPAQRLYPNLESVLRAEKLTRVVK